MLVAAPAPYQPLALGREGSAKVSFMIVSVLDFAVLSVTVLEVVVLGVIVLDFAVLAVTVLDFSLACDSVSQSCA